MSVLETVRKRAVEVWTEEGLLDERVRVVAGPLSVEEAIGTPDEHDFPIQQGKERLLEAGFKDSRGQAFTDHFGTYSGKLSEIAAFDLKDTFSRAIFVATLNAVMRDLDRTQRTVHCKDEGPKLCSHKMPEYIRATFGDPNITLVGFQPAMIEALGSSFKLRVLDLDVDNIGQIKRGTLVEGPDATNDALGWADLLCVTGTTLVNDTIDMFIGDTPVLFYGTTIAGAADLMGWSRFCPMSS
jgi:hypothetical protein